MNLPDDSSGVNKNLLSSALFKQPVASRRVYYYCNIKRIYITQRALTKKSSVNFHRRVLRRPGQFSEGGNERNRYISSSTPNDPYIISPNLIFLKHASMFLEIRISEC